MPTGYTAKIEKGISFNEFLWGCARAFGAFVTERDSSEFPELPLKPSEYASKNVITTQEELEKFLSLNEDELREKYLQELKEKEEQNNKYEANKRELKTRYEDMLVQAHAFIPPTPEHVGLKDFMIEQLETSIDFDCKIYPRDNIGDFEAWKQGRKINLIRSKEYAEKNLKEEIERVNGRNAWIESLMNIVSVPESLKKKVSDD